MVLSGLEWSRSKIYIGEAIRHQNRPFGLSTITNMTTRSGQIILKFSIEWSKVVFVRLSSLISEQGASFENQWSVHLEKLPVEWSSGR